MHWTMDNSNVQTVCLHLLVLVMQLKDALDAIKGCIGQWVLATIGENLSHPSLNLAIQ